MSFSRLQFKFMIAWNFVKTIFKASLLWMLTSLVFFRCERQNKDLFTEKEALKTTVTKQVKGDYPRTRASDSKHLPAMILNVFFVNIIGFCHLCNIIISIKEIKFHHGFIWKKLWNVWHFFTTQHQMFCWVQTAVTQK